MLATFHWTAVPLMVAAAVACVLYRRAWHRAGSGLTRRHAVAFGAAVVSFLVAMTGPLDWLGEERLMSAHMVQHLLLLSATPAFVFGALPLARLGRRARRWPVWVPAVCLLAGLVIVWVLHVPAVLESGLTRPALHDAQHLVMLAAGVLLAWPLTSSGPLLGFAAVAYIVVAEIGIGVLGIWLAWYPEVAYASYEAAPRTWGLSAQTDQSLAGALLLVIEEPFLAVEFAILFIRALGDTTYGG